MKKRNDCRDMIEINLTEGKTAALAAAWLLITNLTAFAMYGLDKLKAKKEKRRIPEKTLIGIAVIGGSLGALAGMYLFRHKTLHKKFTIGVPAILAIQCALAAYLLFLRRS